MLQAASTESVRTSFDVPDQKCGSKFGAVARALWPKKTANELAFRAGVSKRAAEYWLYGQREPSARAILAVFSEILRN